jgi:hypothetical protein
MQDKTLDDETTLPNLSLAERKLVFLMRNMGEFEKIEIKKTADGISITSTATTKEIFHD